MVRLLAAVMTKCSGWDLGASKSAPTRAGFYYYISERTNHPNDHKKATIMPVWPTSQDPDIISSNLSAEVSTHHKNNTGQPAVAVATAPATWSLIGEHTDHAGGIVMMSFCQARAAAAISPRTDHIIKVTEYTYDVAAQEYSSETTETTVVDPSVESDTAAANTRAEVLAHLIGALVQRQLLSRDAKGFDITIMSDIPPAVGLGEDAAIEVATALALTHNAEEIDSPPTRAKLADTCYQAAVQAHSVPPLRARYLATLRGKNTVINVVNYADYSITEATQRTNPILDSQQVTAVLVAPPLMDANTERLIRRQTFINDAARAFGAESIRSLPDAQVRVIDWLRAKHEVHGSADLPSIIEAENWLKFHDAELHLIRVIASTIRGRDITALYPPLTESQSNMDSLYGITGADDHVAKLCLSRGANSARSTHSGISSAVVALVPAAQAANFMADLSDDRLLVMPLHSGTKADLI
ncbi:MAG: galactokinase family protein [Corynebacterium sp.]|nr:galactokinase family protein [Corynebacterium sp.]